MIYGAHCYLFTDKWDDTKLGILETVKDLGLGYFEVSVGDDISFTPELTRLKAEELGITLSVGPGGVWPSKCDLSADDAKYRKLGLAWHQKQVDIAAELGAVAYCGALYGHPGTVKRRRPPENEYAWTAEGLHKLAEYGAERDVKIVLEPMSHFRTHLVNTPEQVIRLIELADHANLYALLDTYHLVNEIRDYAKAIRTVGNKLFSLHACASDRGVPGGDLVPWDNVFRALKETKFDGYVLFETYNSSIGNFAFERGMFHNPCPDGSTFVKEGLEFIRAGFSETRA